MHRFLFSIIILFLSAFELSGQTSSSFSISNTLLISNSKQMPFWFWANTDGKIETENSGLNITEIDAGGVHFFNDSNLFIQAGADLIYGMGNNSRYFQANQIFTRINYKSWEFFMGMVQNDLFAEGLSTTNGNIARSRNARPYPKIGVRLSDYKPVPFFTKFLSFKGEYDEGILYDNRYVDRTHLHHKSLYLKAKFSDNFNVQGGVEHFVMWGGTSQNEKIGKLPDDCSSYFRYITGSRGDDVFPETDQLNVAGNQYGTYQVLLTQKFNSFELSLNISHPFEDFSGVNLHNWPDNLIGLSIKFSDDDKIITHFIYEFTNTRQQSIADSLYYWSDESQKWKSHEYDNYFNHGVYKSGVTYFQKTLSSPLSSSLKIVDGTSRGSISTRYFSHHIGLKGKLNREIAWKGLLTYIKHLGTWGSPYEIPEEQVSGLLNFSYNQDSTPFIIDLTVAGDIANLQPNRFGIQLGVKYIFE